MIPQPRPPDLRRAPTEDRLHVAGFGLLAGLQGGIRTRNLYLRRVAFCPVELLGEMRNHPESNRQVLLGDRHAASAGRTHLLGADAFGCWCVPGLPGRI